MSNRKTSLNTLSRREFLRLTSIGAGTVALAACAPVATPSGAGDGETMEATTIIYLSQGGNEAAVNRYQPLIDAFHEENSDVRIEMQLEPGGAIDVQTKLLTLIAAGEAPDAYWAHSYTNAGQSKRDIQLDVSDFVAADDEINPEDFLPAAWADFHVDGKQVGFPRETTSTVIIYNKELLDAAGITTVEGWTWDDFVAAAAAVTQGEGADKIYGMADFNLNRNTWCRMWQNGGDVLSPDRSEYTMNQAENVAVVEEIAAWHNELGVHIPGVEKGGFTTADLFTTGRIGMYPQFSVFSGIQSAEFEWDVAHLPVDADQEQTTRVASAGHSIYSGTKHQDASWRWLKMLGSEMAYRHWVDGGLSLPSLKKVATDPELFGDGGPASVDVIIDAFDYGRPEPVAGDWIGVHREIQPALDAIYGIEQADAQSTLDAIADRVNELIAALPSV